MNRPLRHNGRAVDSLVRVSADLIHLIAQDVETTIHGVELVTRPTLVDLNLRDVTLDVTDIRIKCPKLRIHPVISPEQRAELTPGALFCNREGVHVSP